MPRHRHGVVDATRDLLDFALGGRHVKRPRRTIPFLNAQSQGQVLGRDAFTERDIVPVHERNLALPLRDMGRASEVGQILSGVLGVDARKIDHVIEGQLGGMGALSLDAIDEVGRWFGGDSERPFKPFGLTVRSPL